MRIVHIANYFMPNMGYQENWLPYEQMRLGNDVAVFTSCRYFPFKNYDSLATKLGSRVFKPSVIHDKGVMIRRYPVLYESPKRANLAFVGFLKDLRRYRPDVVHIHQVQSFMILFVPLIKAVTRCRIFVDSHSDYNVNEITPMKRFYYGGVGLVHRSLGPFINRYLPISEGSVRFLRDQFKIPEFKMSMCYLGANVSRTRVTKSQLRKQLGLPARGLIFVTSGKIDERKKIVEFLKLLAQLPESRQIHILIVGAVEESYGKRMQKEVGSDAVRSLVIRDFTENDSLKCYYHASDVAFFPGNPTISIQESMGCGLPVIIGDTVETSHLRSGGAMVLEQNERANLRNIRRLLDGRYRKARSRQSYEFIKNELTWTKIAKHCIRLYEETQK